MYGGRTMTKLAEEVHKLERQVAYYERALIALRRAHTPGQTCTKDCDSNVNPDADCDCWYVEACDVRQFVTSVLEDGDV